MDTTKYDATLVKWLKAEREAMDEKINKVLDVQWVHYLKRKHLLLKEFNKLGKNEDFLQREN